MAFIRLKIGQVSKMMFSSGQSDSVEVSSPNPKGGGFDSPSEHLPNVRLIPGRGTCGRQPIVSHIDISRLSLKAILKR